MDKRSWPWKKKSLEKSIVPGTVSNTAPTSQTDQENYKKPKYVQISVESYTHLTGLEDQVKSYEEQVKTLDEEIKDSNEKLCTANLEITNKDNIVKQHAKVAEDAISGWEKAEAEALTLKTHLESVTLLQLTAEDRALHLDGALKECMKEIRNLKEEHEQNLHELALNKAKQFDKMKLELEAKIVNLDQQLLRSGGENAALSRSLHERSNMVMKLTEEKVQAESNIEDLKNEIDSCEKEINSLKYELHVVAKEMEIRNEEKNMSVRSAEVANKQHLEGVKKIAKLESECQRLRGLVRKKLPGPAALAQMKIEVDSLGRDYGGTRLRKSPVKPEFSLDSIHVYQKENEVLTECLFSMEEETKMLKEALAKRNDELLTSKSIYASKVENLEAQLLSNGENRKSPLKTRYENVSNPPSLTSLSEDGNDDNVSCSGSWAKTPISEMSRLNREKSVDSLFPKVESSPHLELMDDFLEMEKLASSEKRESDLSPLKKIHSTISMMLESMPKETDKSQFLEGIKGILQDIRDSQSLDSNTKDPSVESLNSLAPEVITAISQIHDFVISIGKEGKIVQVTSPDGDNLSEKLDKFSATYNGVIKSTMNVMDFVLDLSLLLRKENELRFSFESEAETNISDCIDKVALPEDNNGTHFSDSNSNPDNSQEGNHVPISESMWKFSLEEFEEMKQEKDNMFLDLSKCNENLQSTKAQLQETEQLLSEIKSQLTSSQKMNSLSETQLKCMTESYKSLEIRANELQTEMNVLKVKNECLEHDLQEEKKAHDDTLIKCKDLEQQLQRIENDDVRSNQERELLAATEKLAECQESIFLLGKQLKKFHPQTELIGSPFNGEDELYINRFHLHDVDPSESMREQQNSPFTPLDSEPKNPKHRSTKSGSSSTASTPTPEKNSRGFTRFFSSKGKAGN